MPTPSEHKTVQARILAYVQEGGWAFVPQDEAERRRRFDPTATGKDRAKGVSLFFDDLLDEKVREFQLCRCYEGFLADSDDDHHDHVEGITYA